MTIYDASFLFPDTPRQSVLEGFLHYRSFWSFLSGLFCSVPSKGPSLQSFTFPGLQGPRLPRLSALCGSSKSFIVLPLPPLIFKVLDAPEHVRKESSPNPPRATEFSGTWDPTLDCRVFVEPRSLEKGITLNELP